MARAARYRSRGITCAGQHAMAEAKAEGAAPPRYEAEEDTVECAGGTPAEYFSALPSRGKTSPRHETHHAGIRIYITHRNSERAPFYCLCLCDLRSPLAVLVFSSSLPLQWTARCCYCWLCSVWCLLPPLVVSGAIFIRRQEPGHNVCVRRRQMDVRPQYHRSLSGSLERLQPRR